MDKKKNLVVLLFILLLTTNLLSASNLDDIKDIISDPTVSQRCKVLIQNRNEKIQTKQKLSSLLKRNKKLINRARPSQKVVTKRLQITKLSLENSLRLTKFRIKVMEENIVRKGCPGIAL